MIVCKQYEMIISRALDKELSTVEKEELKKHLDLCPKCKKYYSVCGYTDKTLKKYVFADPQTTIAKLEKMDLPLEVIHAILKSENKIEKKRYTISIARKNLPAAAGTTARFSNVPSEILESYGYPVNTAIIAEKREKGYIVYLLSNIFMTLTLAFNKDNRELHKISINNHIPKIVNLPFEKIEGWTHIRLS